MASKYLPFIKGTVAASTGSPPTSITVAAASGFQSPAVGQNGFTYDLSITDGTAWETYRDVPWNNSGPGWTLSSGTFEASSTGSALTTLSTSAVVRATPSAAKFAAIEEQLNRSLTHIANDGSTTQSLGVSAFTKIGAALTTVVSNPRTEWDTTNKKFTPTRAGNYLIFAGCQAGGNPSLWSGAIYKNGVATVSGAVFTGSSAISAVSGLVSLNGSTDYVEFYTYCGTPAQTTSASAAGTFFQAIYLGP